MFEAYKVGITIALTNQVTRGLMLLQRDFHRTDAQAIKLKKTLKDIEKLTIKGAIFDGVGYAGLKAIGGTVKYAEEYVHQLELAKSAGMSQLEIAKATATAWKTTGDVLTTTASDNLKAMRELRMVFGDTDHAIGFLPQMQKIQAVLDATLHGQGGVGAKDVAFTAAKALELRGASINPETFRKQADLIVKGVIASGGRFTPAALLQAQKYGGIGATGYSNDFVYGIMPTLVQELGGSSTGTALTSMYRALVGGRIDKKALKVWQSLGLLSSVSGVTGETAMVQARNATLFQNDPFAYMQYLEQQMKAKEITDPAKQQQSIEQLFSNRTAGRMANILMLQGGRLQKDFNLIGQAGTSAEYDRLIKTDPVMARQAAAAQWENLKTVVGLQVVPVLIPAIKSFADSLHTLSSWAQSHPTLFKTLIWGFVGVSSAMLFSGVVLTLKAAFLGLSAVIGLAGGSTVVGTVTSLVGVLMGPVGLVAAIGLAAAATVVWHRQIANWIDSTDIGKKVGDALLWAKEHGAFSPQSLMNPAEWAGGQSGNRAGGQLRGAVVGAMSSTRSPSAIHTTVNIDGRKVAEAVSSHQAKATNGPQASSNMFDGRQSYSPVGSTGGW